MHSYRNIFYHNLLDCHIAVPLLHDYQGRPHHEHELPPVEEAATSNGQPSNLGEYDLAEIIVQAGLPRFEHQRSIDLGKPLGTTVADLYYEDLARHLQVAIYLDGLSKGLCCKNAWGKTMGVMLPSCSV